MLRKFSKTSPILLALGDIDELNCCLGLAKSFSAPRPVIENIQKDLMTIGSFLAGAKKEIKLRSFKKEITRLKNPKLTTFVLPGKNQSSAFLHLTRSVCRRAERSVVKLKNRRFQKIEVYLNELSSLLFWLAEKSG